MMIYPQNDNDNDWDDDWKDDWKDDWDDDNDNYVADDTEDDFCGLT